MESKKSQRKGLNKRARPAETKQNHGIVYASQWSLWKCRNLQFGIHRHCRNHQPLTLALIGDHCSRCRCRRQHHCSQHRRQQHRPTATAAATDSSSAPADNSAGADSSAAADSYADDSTVSNLE